MHFSKNTTKSTEISTENTTRRGCVVEVRVFGGDVVERVVWDEDASSVYLCSRRCYDRLLSGDASTRPIGFPRDSLIRSIGPDQPSIWREQRKARQVWKYTKELEFDESEDALDKAMNRLEIRARSGR